MAGWLPLFASAATGGVSGKALIGFSIDTGMFKNLASNASDLYAGAITYPIPSDLNADGYPTNSASMGNDIARTIPFPSTLTSSDTLVFRWTGTASNASGALAIRGDTPGFTVTSDPGSVVIGGTSHNIFMSGTDGRIEFNLNSPILAQVGISFTVSSTYTDLSNIILCKKTEEAAILAATTPEELFDDDYIALFQSLNPGVVRPMGWTNPNGGNVSQSKYIPNWQTGLDLTCPHWEPGAWAGRTTNTSDGVYTAGSQPDATGAYVDGEMIHVQWDATCSGTAMTIDVGSRGVKPILYGDGGSTGNPLAYVTQDYLGTLTYDSVLDAFLYQAGGQTPCVPYELQVAFANRVNAHYWLNFPGYIDNASVTAIVGIVRDGLASTLDGYFEYGNELWNPTFPATPWCDAKGVAMGVADGDNRRKFSWHALRHRIIMGLVTAAWSPRSTAQLKRVMAFQAYGDPVASKAYLLEGGDLVTGNSVYNTYTGSISYNASPNRPVDYVDVLSYATYYSGGQLLQFDANYVTANTAGLTFTGLTGAADDFASGGAGIATALAWLDNDIRAGTMSSGAVSGTFTLQDFNGTGGQGRNVYGAWETVAASYDGSRAVPLTVELYEGGEGGVAPSTATCTTIGISTTYGGPGGKIDNLIIAYRNSDLFYDTVKLQYSQFMSRTHSKTPAWLLVTGLNAWSMSTGDVYAAKFKSWDANVDYNNGV